MFEFDIEEMKLLISGRFKTFKCLECGGIGAYWVDSVNGVIVSHPDKDRDSTDYYYEGCEQCMGLGYNLVLGE